MKDTKKKGYKTHISDKKKKELAEKSMPDPVVKKKVTEADDKAEMGCKHCGSKAHKSHEHKKHEK